MDATAAPQSRVTTGPFEMEGVSWVQYGHAALVYSLEMARKLADELLERGYRLHSSRELEKGGLVYQFKFMRDTPTRQYEIIDLTLIAVSYEERPPYEIAYRPTKRSGWWRFGDRTFVGEAQIDGTLADAYNEHGREIVITRPTLVP